MASQKSWFLRKKDGSEYGPVSLHDLQRWSAQCRLVAGNAVSHDREEWVPVESLPELEMNWRAKRSDGKEYGPFSLSATQELFDHGVLPEDAILTHVESGAQKKLSDVLKESDSLAKEEKDPIDEISEEPDKKGVVEDNHDTPPDAGDVSSLKNDEHFAALETELAAVTKEADDLRQQVDALQRKLKRVSEAASDRESALVLELEQREKALQEARQAHEAAEAKVTSLAETEERAAEKYAEEQASVRKQVAFMKKNIAMLNSENSVLKATLQRRFRVILVLSSILSLLFLGLIVRTLSGGCSRRSEPLPLTTSSQKVIDPKSMESTSTLPDLPDFKQPGTIVNREANRLIIAYEQPVFESLDTLSDHGKSLLRDGMVMLLPYLDRWVVVVEGHTDDVPLVSSRVFRDNEALARARAEAAVAFLRSETGIPANAVRISRNPGPPPFPNDSHENRLRNRTVVLRVEAR